MNTHTTIEYVADAVPEDAPAGIIQHLPNLLRWLGGAVLVFAMYSFLLKGWQGGNDVFRYLLMLGHTGLLAIAGLASGHWLKEGKGARLLVTLALVSVPVNFAILGAFMFSGVQAVLADAYPHYVAWTVDSLSTALWTTGAAALVLVPVTLLGFTVLARNYSRRLSVLFLISNLLLLVPLRGAGFVGLVVLALVLGTVLVNHGAARGDASLKTREGITALALQMLPMGILLGRSLWLYSADELLLTVMTVAVFFILRQMSLYLPADSTARKWLELISTLPALATAFFLSVALGSAGSMPDVLVLPVSSLLSAAMFFDLSLRSARLAAPSRFAMLGILAMSTLFNLQVMPGFSASVVTVVFGVGLAVLGFRQRFLSLFLGGIGMAALGTLQQFYELFHHFQLGSWAAMAILGVVFIVVASVIEARGQGLKRRFASLRERLDDWQR